MNILVGYDGSNAAKDAVRLAQKHAKAFDAGVHIMTSLPGGDETSAEDVQKAEKGLAEAKATFDQEGVPCDTHVIVHGQAPGEDLVEFAKDKSIDQIVVGVRRRSRVGKMLMGSTAQYVILEAPCPVLSIK
ncbi:MAG: universal stress protein [Thermodesulfobacteriota bacterium]